LTDETKVKFTGRNLEFLKTILDYALSGLQTERGTTQADPDDEIWDEFEKDEKKIRAIQERLK